MTTVVGLFWLQGHNLNELGRGLLGDATGSMPFGFRQEVFSRFPYIHIIYKHVPPGGCGIFGPRGIIRKKTW